MDKKEALKQINSGKDEEGNNYFSLADAHEKLKVKNGRRNEIRINKEKKTFRDLI